MTNPPPRALTGNATDGAINRLAASKANCAAKIAASEAAYAAACKAAYAVYAATCDAAKATMRAAFVAAEGDAYIADTAMLEAYRAGGKPTNRS